MSRKVNIHLSTNDLKNRDLPFMEKYIYGQHHASQHVRLSAIRRALDYLLPNDKYVSEFNVAYYASTDEVAIIKENAVVENFDISFNDTNVLSINFYKSLSNQAPNVRVAGSQTTFARSMELLDLDIKFMTGTEQARRPGFDVRGLYNNLRPMIRDIASPCQQIWTSISDGLTQYTEYTFVFPEENRAEDDGRMTYITVKLYNIAGVRMTEEDANSYGAVGLEHVSRFPAVDEKTPGINVATETEAA